MLLLALFVLAVPIPRGAPGRTVAVLEFESQLAPGESVDRVYFSDKVRGEIARNLPAARVMTRENVVQLLTASGKKLEDCVGECEVETGRMLGADLVVSGRLTKVGTRFKLSLRLHATADGTLVSTATASGETVDKLDDAGADAVADLLSPIAVPAAPRAAAAAQAGPPPALLIVESVPAGARVLVDGHERGAAPLSIEGLAPGTHRLRLELPDYQAAEQDTQVQAAKTARERVTLQRLRGRLSVQSAQAARCSAGGQEHAIDEGGLEVFDVPVGTWEVRCSASGYETFTESVTVKSGQTSAVRARLERERAVSSTPRNYGPLLRSLAGAAILGGGGALVASRFDSVRTSMSLTNGTDNRGVELLSAGLALGVLPGALATAFWGDDDDLGVVFALEAGAFGGLTAASAMGLWFAGQDGSKVPARGSFGTGHFLLAGGVALGATGASLLVQGLRSGFDLGPEKVSHPRAHAALYAMTGAALAGVGGVMVAQRVAVARSNFVPSLGSEDYPAGSTIGLASLGTICGAIVTMGWARRSDGVPWLATAGGTAAGAVVAMLAADNWTFALGMGLVGSGIGLVGAAVERSQSSDFASTAVQVEPSAIAVRTPGGLSYGPGLAGRF